MVLVVYIILVVVGLSAGSFVNALVWRIYEQSKRQKEKKFKKVNLSVLNGRSVCPNCAHELAATDLVPLISWLWLRGKCRYCSTPISWQYPLVEAATSAIFVLSYIYWPLTFQGEGLFTFVLWLVFLTGLMALFVYDLRWQILPDRITFPLLILAVIQVLIVATVYNRGWNSIVSAFWGVLVLGGLFYAIFQLSQGKWIGGGDVKLGALLGLLAGGPLNSFLLLFLASAGGTLLAIPLLITRRVERTSHLPFGPFLIAACSIVVLFGANIINWYKSRFLGF